MKSIPSQVNLGNNCSYSAGTCNISSVCRCYTDLFLFLHSISILNIVIEMAFIKHMYCASNCEEIVTKI